jgi:hypothetical protein
MHAFCGPRPAARGPRLPIVIARLHYYSASLFASFRGRKEWSRASRGSCRRGLAVPMHTARPCIQPAARPPRRGGYFRVVVCGSNPWPAHFQIVRVLRPSWVYCVWPRARVRSERDLLERCTRATASVASLRRRRPAARARGPEESVCEPQSRRDDARDGILDVGSTRPFSSRAQPGRPGGVATRSKAPRR